MAYKKGETKLKKEVKKVKKNVGLKDRKDNKDPNPSYQRELIECFKKGYAQFSGKGDKKGTEEQRLAIREECRSSKQK